MGVGVSGFRVECLVFWGLGFGVWSLGLGFGVWGVGFGVWGLESMVERFRIEVKRSWVQEFFERSNLNSQP